MVTCVLAHPKIGNLIGGNLIDGSLMVGVRAGKGGRRPLRGTPAVAVPPQNYCKAIPRLVSVLLTFKPVAFIETAVAIDISATSRPYSKAVAPRVSRHRLRKKSIMNVGFLGIARRCQAFDPLTFRCEIMQTLSSAGTGLVRAPICLD